MKLHSLKYIPTWDRLEKEEIFGCFFPSKKPSAYCSKANFGKLLSCFRKWLPGPMKLAGFFIVILVSIHWSEGGLLSDRDVKRTVFISILFIIHLFIWNRIDWPLTVCANVVFPQELPAVAQREMLLKQQESAEWTHVLAPNSPACTCSLLMTVNVVFWGLVSLCRIAA